MTANRTHRIRSRWASLVAGMRAAPQQPPHDLRIDTEAALLEEFAAILTPADRAQTTALPSRDGSSPEDLALWNTPRAALCLSGGGIRSAAFSLGVLQSLAHQKLLLEFHYLSTVSGGGYIGGWLAAVIARGGGVAAAQTALTQESDSRREGLRAYTNFLTPEPGLISADTRAAFILWLRNVLLNWLIFGPAMFALALLPGIYAGLLATTAPVWLGTAAGVAGILALAFATFQVCCDIPAHGYELAPGATTAGVATRVIHARIVAPVLIWALLGPLAYAWRTPWHDTRHGVSPLAAGTFLALVGGFTTAWVSLPAARRDGFRQNAPWWIIASLLAAGLLQLGIRLGASLSFAAIATLGPLWVIGTHMLQSTAYVGLRRSLAYAELDREWLARLNADKVAPALLWAALAAATLLLPEAIGTLTPAKILAYATGPAGAWLASSARSAVGRKTPPASTGSWAMMVLVETAIGLATVIFAALLLMAFAIGGFALVCAYGSGGHRLPALALLAAVSFAVAYGLGQRVDVNRFSLHGVYRVRLIRAFLGTARLSGRRPDAFTNFDPTDNLRMHTLYDRAQPGRRLFPVVNMTLNLVTTKRTAWAERKAAPFTATPLRTGADCLHLPNRAQGVFVRSECYGGGEAEGGAQADRAGIALGGAMTISGAAVSPNMGYNTRPATAFLMTLFDVRLGAWMPNPAKFDTVEDLNQGRPNNALFALAAEMFGRSDDQRDNVYLSDGGHFDNLGLYEMLRRECRMILVVDAGCDDSYVYADLGDSVRRAAIDLGARVDFDPAVRSTISTLPQGGARAAITYRSGAIGSLIYLKPWLPPQMAADIMAYAAAHHSFPHEPTSDQFFTESQFESYRHLGETIGKMALGDATSLGALFAPAHAKETPP